jgi:hypothetical protein
MVHSTSTGNRIKALRYEVRQVEPEIKAAQKLARAGRDVKAVLEDLESSRDNVLAEALGLKDSRKIRLEDLAVWEMEKTKVTKKGIRSYIYWMASWREEDRVKNVHLGSSRVMDRDAALDKARKMKAEALGLK